MGIPLRLLIGSLVMMSSSGFLLAQIPDAFTNLKLLPEDISKRQLIDTMRDWATGLGVRCNHCHVGPDNLQGMDFANDEKKTKQTARRMLQMSREINGGLLKDLPTLAEDASAQVVSCFTCHRGLARPPRNLSNELGQTYAEAGAEAALEQYRAMRLEHFGSGRYNFSPDMLTMLAAQLAQSGKPEEALQVLDTNREFYPESADIEAATGMVYMMSGRMDEAEEQFRKALAMDSNNGQAKSALARLEQMKAQAPEE